MECARVSVEKGERRGGYLVVRVEDCPRGHSHYKVSLHVHVLGRYMHVLIVVTCRYRVTRLLFPYIALLPGL